MQPKKKISGGGFQLKESGIKSPLVSVALFSASHTHACTCVCSYACWTQRVFPHSPPNSQSRSVQMLEFACVKANLPHESQFCLATTPLLLAHLRTHFFTLYLCSSCLTLLGLLKLICLAGRVPWSWATLCSQNTALQNLSLPVALHLCWASS